MEKSFDRTIYPLQFIGILYIIYYQQNYKITNAHTYVATFCNSNKMMDSFSHRIQWHHKDISLTQ